jgi:hypothetical protein
VQELGVGERPVLHLAKLATIPAGLLEERLDVHDAHHVDARAEEPLLLRPGVHGC